MTYRMDFAVSSYGIAQLTIEGVGIDAIKAAKTQIISELKATLQRGRESLNRAYYTPQYRPLMWWLSYPEYGLMVDVVAVDDATIDSRADEIIAKLCRDCQMLGGVQ